MPSTSEPGPSIPSPRSDRRPGIDPVRRFIICGDTPLAYRIADELISRYRVKVTVMLTDDRGADALLIARLPGVVIKAVPELNAAAFREANLTTADAVAIVTSDDVANVYVGLQAQDTCPGIRLVLRVFNSTLGQRLGPLFDNAQLLSDVEIAVPAFVAACLGTTEPTEVTIGGLAARVTTRAELMDGDEVWCGLAITDRRSMRLLPDDVDAADLVLAAPGPEAETSAVREVVTLRRYRRRRRLVPSPIVATVRATLRSVGALQPGIPAQPGETAATSTGASDVGRDRRRSPARLCRRGPARRPGARHDCPDGAATAASGPGEPRPPDHAYHDGRSARLRRRGLRVSSTTISTATTRRGTACIPCCSPPLVRRTRTTRSRSRCRCCRRSSHSPVSH